MTVTFAKVLADLAAGGGNGVSSVALPIVANVGSADDTATVQAAAEQAISEGRPLFFPAEVASIGEIATVGPLEVIAAPGAVIKGLAGASFLWDFDCGGGLVKLDGVTLDCDNNTGMERISQFSNGRAVMNECEGRNFLRTASGTSNAFRIANTMARFHVEGGYYHDIIGTNEIFRSDAMWGTYNAVHMKQISWHGIRFGNNAAGVVSGGCLVEEFSRSWAGGPDPSDAGGSAYIAETGSRDVTIMESHARDGRQLCKMDGALRVKVIGCTGRIPAGAAGGQGIQIDSSKDVLTSHNQLYDYDRCIGANAASEDVKIIGNQLWRPPEFGIRVAGTRGSIMGNDIYDAVDFAINLISTSSGWLVDNNYTPNAGGTAIANNGTGNTIGTNYT